MHPNQSGERMLNYLRTIVVLALFQGSSLSASLMLWNTWIAHPSNPNQKIEIVWADSSENKGMFPLVLLLHGTSAKKGANDFKVDVFRFWTERGFVAAAVSLPDYGFSDGPNDYCGPFTMSAMHAVLDFFKNEGHVPAIGVVGFGVGGLAATLLTGQREDISFVVSANGVYDLSKHLDETDPLRQLIEKERFFEWNEKELQERSAQMHAHRIKTPLFLLHHHPHPTVSIEEVHTFAHAVNENGGECVVKVLPFDGDSKISHAVLIAEAEDWLFRKY